MKKLLLFSVLILAALLFHSCEKDEVVSLTTPQEEINADSNFMLLSVAQIEASETEPSFYNVTFNGSAAIFLLPKNASEELEILSQTRKENQPVRFQVEELLIKRVEFATSDEIDAYREALSYAVDTLSEADLLGNLKRANDVIPNRTTLNQIFDALQNMSAVDYRGRRVSYRLSYSGYNLGRVPFQYAVDGCFARAHAMKKVIEDNFGFNSYKRFIIAPNSNIPLNVRAQKWGNSGCCITWRFHVAPVVKVRTSGNKYALYVLDPSLFSKPVSVATWDNSMIGNTSTTCKNNSRYRSRYKGYYTYSSAYNFIEKSNGEPYFFADHYYRETYKTMRSYRYKMSCR